MYYAITKQTDLFAPQVFAEIIHVNGLFIAYFYISKEQYTFENLDLFKAVVLNKFKLKASDWSLFQKV